MSISPGDVTLKPGQSQQFTARVTRTANPNSRNGVATAPSQAVTWTLSSPVGTVTPGGLYTAPAALRATVKVKLTAKSVEDPRAESAVTITIEAPPVSPTASVAVSVTPAQVSLGQGQTQQFAALVTGTANTAVTWSVSPAVGTVTAGGLYTAPASITSQQTVQVRAVSVADPTKSAAAAVTLVPPAAPVAVTLTPSTATLVASQTQQFVALVTGTANTGVVWSLNPAVGTLSTSGATAVYTAPSNITQQQTVEVAAASVAAGSKIAKAVLTLVPVVAVSVSPAVAAVEAGQSVQFAATVTGTTNTAVTWSLNPAVGSITAGGLYTAPGDVTADQVVAVTAQSAADTSKKGAAAVTIKPPPDKSGIKFTIDQNRLTSLTYNGQDYFVYADYLVYRALFRLPDGTEINEGWQRPSVTRKGSNPEYFEHVYRSGQPRQYTVRLTWTTPDSRTLRVDADITNNDPQADLVDVALHFVPIKTPGPAREYNQNIPMAVNQSFGKPAEILSGPWGSVAYWQTGYPHYGTFGCFYGRPDLTEFDLILGTTTKPKAQETVIKPGSTKRFTVFLRFGGPTETAMTLAPEAFEEFRRAFPYAANWPDRRPIGTWFLAEGTKRSAVNPRGYLWDPELDVTNRQMFRDRLLASAAQTIEQMNRATPRPQGIVIWDLEGQEFNHAFTYLGAPNRLRELAPEMDAVADELFGMFRSSGYRVGVTIRPQTFGIGTTLPSACSAGSNYWLADKFVKLDALFPYRLNVCEAGNAWRVSSNEWAAQKSVDEDEQILAILRQKISYARTRWGATLFYIDSTAYAGSGPFVHTVMRTLAAEFPDCLLMPEIAHAYYWGSTAPYRQANMGDIGTPSAAKQLYPNAFSVVNVADVDFGSNWNRIVESVRSGDILLFRAWFGSPEIPAIRTIYEAAGTPAQ